MLIINKDKLSHLEKKILSDLEQEMFDKMNPEWKVIHINEIKSTYEVSNSGNIRNIITGVILTPAIGKNGYQKVFIRITVDCRRKIYSKLVHRLVAEAFIPNPENKPQVNHIDGNKIRNWWGNLEWNTRSENMVHAFKLGLQKSKKGSSSPVSIYNDNQIHQVCKLLESKIPYQEISEKTNVLVDTIASIASKSRWKHISSLYNIETISKPRRSKDYDDRIRELISKKYKTGEIRTELGWPNNPASRNYINFIRKKMLLSSSTTIEPLQ